MQIWMICVTRDGCELPVPASPSINSDNQTTLLHIPCQGIWISSSESIWKGFSHLIGHICLKGGGGGVSFLGPPSVRKMGIPRLLKDHSCLLWETPAVVSENSTCDWRLTLRSNSHGGIDTDLGVEFMCILHQNVCPVIFYGNPFCSLYGVDFSDVICKSAVKKKISDMSNYI